MYSASGEFCVPESALTDRTRGNITLHTKVGVETLFTESEKKLLVDHVKYMASIGYDYNKSGVQYMAREIVISLIKSVKFKNSLSNPWSYDYLKRWPGLKTVKPQKPAMYRAKCFSKENWKIISRSWTVF